MLNKKMEMELKLFMVLIGCRPPGRATEQHDIFFGIAEKVSDLIPDMKAYWPEARGRMHVDAWREVTFAHGFRVVVTEKGNAGTASDAHLYFINLGGYKPMEFEEYHYKMVVAAPDMAGAIKVARQSAFYKHTGYKGATAHVDDKYGIDVDDAALVSSILQTHFTDKYKLSLQHATDSTDDVLHIGYFKLEKL